MQACNAVNLPLGLYDKVKELVRNRKDLGYKYITEFVAESVRKRLEEIEKLDALQKQVDIVATVISSDT